MAISDKRFFGHKSQNSIRIKWLAIIIFLFAFVIMIRLFNLQVMQHSFYSLLASETHEVYKNLFPQRGSIYVKENNELYPLVTNRDYYLVYVDPSKVEDPAEFIDKITPILGLTEEEWKSLLGKLADTSDPYEPIKQKVSKDVVDQIKALDLAGVGFLPESYRYYPDKSIGGHIFGFVGFKDNEKQGQYGLEGYFNQELTGKSGLLKSIKDALGSLITIGPRSVQPAQDGVDLILTIDRKVQFTACQKLKEFYDWFKADQGSVIIMEPSTGAIIAMCSFPDFDPEFYNEVQDINYFNNPVIFSDFEPGSIFKPITMAAGLDTGKVTPQSTYVDSGEVKIGPFTIKNSDLKSHDEQTMTQVLEKSLNTGAIFVADQVGKNVFKRYVENFGFGEKTDITLNLEVPGNISSLSKSGDIYYYTASFGQGITATPLQLVTAFAAIANKGKLLKPYIVAEIVKPDGSVEKTKVKEVRQVIQPKTATLLTGMMTSVVENGYGQKARVNGYYLAGKTGTAQVASAAGGYGRETIHSFVGFGPVSNPKFVILIKLNNPKGITYAADSITPLFRQLSEFLLNYYQIPPDY